MNIQDLIGAEINALHLGEKLALIKNAKENVSRYQWLYHCTTADALISIVKNREFWLRTLKDVNDDEEYKRIDAPEYESAYYVACLTYQDNVPPEHWKEYGSEECGVLFSVKPEWFVRQADFMVQGVKDCNPFFKIFNNEKSALAFKISEQELGRITYPYFVFEFNFYQIIYDDGLIENIKSDGVMSVNSADYKGRVYVPEVAGIIKSSQGKCARKGHAPYIKNWKSEKEVRLKVGIIPYTSNADFRIRFPYIAVPLTEDAFQEFFIRFSPKFNENMKRAYITQLNKLLPNSQIHVIN